METLNIIGDVAGEFDTLMELLKKMPTADRIVLLGDLNDRGPKSKEVIEWAMNNTRVITLHSNHGDMFIDFIRANNDPNYEMRYSTHDFLTNGGDKTLLSYCPENMGLVTYEAARQVPMRHINWLDKRPLTYISEGVVCSHAPRGKSSSRIDAVWNRNTPIETEGMVNIFGHNSMWGLRYFGDKNNPWAICIDTSWDRILTGITWPNLTVYQQEYL